MRGKIEVDVERYSYLLRYLGGAALLLLVLAILSPPRPPKEYDERCFYDHCVARCGEMEYRLGRFDYGNFVRCICLTNVTQVPVQLYSLRASQCPPVKKDRRCEASFCEEVCVKEEGFLPGHSSLRWDDGYYTCICRDEDVGWHEEAYEVKAEKCSS